MTNASLDDTIAAISTAPGAGGLAVVRVSGPLAFAVSATVFEGGAVLERAPSHTLHHGWAIDSSRRRLDEVVAAVFRAPHSYTREDVVEFSCHGGTLPARGVLDALLAAGARPAGPGEFTMRAFLHGRLDLAQAEAVADLIAAESEGARDLALTHLAGELSRRLGALAERLADAVAEVEARVDFAEDVGGVEVPAHVVAAIESVSADLDALLAGQLWGRALRDGARVPLVGRPNVGKSSLFNRLVGEERSIVTAVPGTTRDRVTESVVWEGARLTFSDTAGLRETDDPVEAIGVTRTRELLESSHAVVLVADGSRSPTREDREIARSLEGGRVIVALNKLDLGPGDGPARMLEALALDGAPAFPVSAATGEGLERLRAGILDVLGLASCPGGGAAVANPRHVDALGRARGALARARAAAAEGRPGEIVSVDLREALAGIDDVRGLDASADLLDRIFSRFCIGK